MQAVEVSAQVRPGCRPLSLVARSVEFLFHVGLTPRPFPTPCVEHTPRHPVCQLFFPPVAYGVAETRVSSPDAVTGSASPRPSERPAPGRPRAGRALRGPFRGRMFGARPSSACLSVTRAIRGKRKVQPVSCRQPGPKQPIGNILEKFLSPRVYIFYVP